MADRRDQRSPEALQYRRRYASSRWKGPHGIRAQQLRKQPLCEMCLKAGRYTPATVCDHVDPKSKETEAGFYAGPFASLCKPHHDSAKQSEERWGYSGEVGLDGWPTDERHPANSDVAQPKSAPMAHPAWFRRSAVPLILVCGPSGSGKSTYVRQHAGPRDRIICFDLIAGELLGRQGRERPAANITTRQVGDILRIRNEALADLMRSEAKTKWPAAWLIVAEPKPEHRQWWHRITGASVIVLATPAEECHRRILADAEAGDRRGQSAIRSVDRWWREYAPAECDVTLSGEAEATTSSGPHAAPHPWGGSS